MVDKPVSDGLLLRVSGVAAVGFAAIILLTNLLIFVPAGLPTTGADTETVIEFFTADSGMVALGSVFLPAAWLSAVGFAAGVFGAIRHRADGRGEAWALIGLAGVISQNITVVAVSAIRVALASTASASNELVAALWAIHDSLFTFNGTFLAMALLGLSLGGLRAGLITRWHAVLGFIAAALQFASATLTPLVVEHGGALGLIGLSGWLLWVVWLVVYGVVLIRRGNGRPVAESEARTARSSALEALDRCPGPG